MSKHLCIINVIGKDLFINWYFGKDACFEDFYHWWYLFFLALLALLMSPEKQLSKACYRKLFCIKLLELSLVILWLLHSLGGKKWKCQLHRPGFGHQIVGAPAANQIALFSLIRFKYSTLTHQIRSPDGVVVSTSGCSAEGRGIESCWTRLPKIALESYNATNSFFFSKILFLELGLEQWCQLRDSKLNS